MKARTPAEVVVQVPGKINLCLRSGARRPDGYHQLATIFQAVSVFDEVKATPAAGGEIRLHVSGKKVKAVPTGKENLAYQAAALLARWTGRAEKLGVELSIHKRIPVSGGMAGGSADAAAALLACAKLWNIEISIPELTVLGAQLGADVPFCLRGGTALGVNRGDVLTPVMSRGTYHWLLAFSDEGLSTATVFSTFDAMSPTSSDQVAVDETILSALATGDAAALGKALVNDLQAAALKLRPDLEKVLAAGLDLGALGAVISGSGPTVGFLCKDEKAAIELSVRLSSVGLGSNLRRVHGPVPGARVIG
ncbi:MAG: 4-(cytidine 5'-diphospho)-2-C-methyl-D-erythritol kinase [Propionibacteriaceae bacterium]|nr:4-(cytidine 5'-diphospho)-2-C-methyl-D-erythritol kinase [Propionibacteriaceae bacterium]